MLRRRIASKSCVALSARVRRSAACRVWHRIACPPAGIAATSDSAAPASAMTDFANAPTRSITCLGLRPHSRANCCQCLPWGNRRLSPAILCADFGDVSQTSPHITSYIGANVRRCRHYRIILGVGVGVAARTLNTTISSKRTISVGGMCRRVTSNMSFNVGLNSGLVGLVLGGWRRRAPGKSPLGASDASGRRHPFGHIAEQVDRFVCRLGRCVPALGFSCSRRGQAERLVLHAAKAQRVRRECVSMESTFIGMQTQQCRPRRQPALSARRRVTSRHLPRRRGMAYSAVPL